MKYAIIVAFSAAVLSVGAATAGAQSTPRTAAQNAWCATHAGQCVAQRDVRRDRTDIVKDMNKIRRQRVDVRKDAHDIRTDRARYGSNPTPAQQRDLARDRAGIRDDRQDVKSAKHDVRTDRRDVKRDRKTDGN